MKVMTTTKRLSKNEFLAIARKTPRAEIEQTISQFGGSVDLSLFSIEELYDIAYGLHLCCTSDLAL